MEVHQGDQTVLVVGSTSNFEFRESENGLEPVSSEVPTEVYDILEDEGYDVNRPDTPREFEDLRFNGPYEGSEATSVLEYDRSEPRFEKLQELMDYGINVSVKVYPDGTTEVYEINGNSLSDPIEI